MHTVMSKYHLGAKIVIQYLGLSGALLWINVLSGHELWSTGYVIPFMGIVATLLITIFCSSKRSHWREFSSYLLTMIFLGFVPLLFYTLGLSDILWTAISAAVYGLLTVGGMCVLAGKESP
ncbi:hypothetical protein JCM10914_1308 [Paenibacillus sp. JCM 10914]|nr:hypothetical protein JCM10914_1308 [Paenibacillus sp. JCM 10914]